MDLDSMLRTRLPLVLFLLLFSALPLYGQRSASISGVVIDKATGDPLPGANVFIEGTSIGSAANEEGEYRVLRVPAGSYVLVARYIGYQEAKTNITLAGDDIVVNIELEFATVEGGDIIVTAQAEGQMAAINQQIASETITNVVSADKIQDIPDANAAESVARLPGVSIIRSGGEGQQVAVRGLSPQYNVMMVNGVRMQSTDRDNRSVDLNMIAPNVLSGIEVTKALTADMDADAVGGTVNLKIGKAAEGLKGNFSFQDGYGSVGETYGNWRGTALVSNRFLQNRLGVQLSGYIDDYNRNSDVLSAGYAVNEELDIEDGLTVLDLRSAVIRDRVTDRQRKGAGLILDYELPFGVLQVNNFISNLSEDQVEMQNSLSLLGNQFNAFGAIRELSNTVISNALQGEFEFDVMTVDFSLSNSISQQDRPGDLQMNIVAEQNQAAFTRTVDETATPSEFLNDVEVQDILRVSRIFTVERDIREAAQDAALNVTFPFNVGNTISGQLKIGGKYTYNSRDNDETQRFNQPDRTFEGERFVAAMRESLWVDLGLERVDENLGIRATLFQDEDYDIGDFLAGEEDVNDFFYIPSVEKMRRFEQLAIDNGAYFFADQQSFERDFDYSRDFSAFYAATEIKVGRFLTLFPGIRYEQFDMNYNAFLTEKFGPNFEDFSNEELNSQSKADTWFPQLQVRIKPTNWLDVRLASTKSIIYPDYRALSPFVYLNTFSGPFMTLGNPALEPATAQNYDIYASVYEDHIGLFTAGFFRKEIDNLIVPFSFRTRDSERVNNRVELSESATTDIRTWINLDATSTVEGFELEWQTNLWYLSNFLRGLVFSINYTHISSETAYPFQVLVRLDPDNPFSRTELVDSTRTGRMPDQPNDVLNATLGYDFKGFSARLSFLYQDNVLGSPGVRDELDSYTDALYRWDLVLYQDLPWRGFQAYMNVNNITNSSDRQFVSVLEKLSSADYYGRTIDLGIRYEF